MVGRDASRGAWLVAQHSDDTPNFQKWCLTQMKSAQEKGDVDPIDVADLEDRVAAREGRKQRWGTQGSAAALYTPQERIEVDQRRKTIGLPSMEETARQLSNALTK